MEIQTNITKVGYIQARIKSFLKKLGGNAEINEEGMKKRERTIIVCENNGKTANDMSTNLAFRNLVCYERQLVWVYILANEKIKGVGYVAG